MESGEVKVVDRVFKGDGIKAKVKPTSGYKIKSQHVAVLSPIQNTNALLQM